MPFDKDAALYAIEFFQLLKHTKGKFHGEPFILLDWQYDTLWHVYGTLNDKGVRQYQYVYLEIPKKNGKTELAAGAGVYHTFADGEIKGEVYGCAADRGQASLCFDVAVDMIDQTPALKKRTKLRLSQKRLEDKVTGTFYQVLSAEAFTKHGLNPSAVIFDELHAQPNRDLWDVMTFGAGSARAQPIWWVITTAGDDPDRTSIGWEQHEYARKVLEGEITDPIWYVKIYGLPDDADIYDEQNWYKANPSLGKTIDIETVRQEALGARNDPAKERLFRWLRLNQWVKDRKQIDWLPQTMWDACGDDFSPADLVGKECWAGLDLSSCYDITAIALLFPPQRGLKKWYVLFEGWIPEDNMKERSHRDHVPYDRWTREGWLLTTPGNVIDYDFIEARVIALSKQYRFREVGYDKWNASQMSQRLAKQGLTMVEVIQGMKTLAPAMEEYERLIRKQDIQHNRNPVARWMFGNIAVKVDENRNKRPVKHSDKERIDMHVALLNAMARALLHKNEAPRRIGYREVKVI